MQASRESWQPWSLTSKLSESAGIKKPGLFRDQYFSRTWLGLVHFKLVGRRVITIIYKSVQQGNFLYDYVQLHTLKIWKNTIFVEDVFLIKYLLRRTPPLLCFLLCWTMLFWSKFVDGFNSTTGTTCIVTRNSTM